MPLTRLEQSSISLILGYSHLFAVILLFLDYQYVNFLPAKLALGLMSFFILVVIFIVLIDAHNIFKGIIEQLKKEET